MNTENKENYDWDNRNLNKSEDETTNFSDANDDNSSYVDQYQNEVESKYDPNEESITNADDAIVNEEEDLDDAFLDALEEDEDPDDEIDESDIDDDLVEDYDENDRDINDQVNYQRDVNDENTYQKESYSAKDNLDLEYDIDQDLEEKDPVNHPRKF